MQEFVRSFALAVCAKLAFAGAAAAQGIYLPPAPQGPGGEDTIESSSGTRCRQSINSNKGYVDVGVAGTAGSGLPEAGSVFVSINSRNQEATAYARVVVPIGPQPKRLDCSRIYELEIERLRGEIEVLKMNAGGLDEGAAGTSNGSRSPAARHAKSDLVAAAGGDRIYFDSGSDELTSDARALLVRLVGWLQKNPDATITLEGRADEGATHAFNIALGNRRTDSVRAFLVQHGIAASRLAAVSVGKDYGRSKDDASTWDEKSGRSVLFVVR